MTTLLLLAILTTASPNPYPGLPYYDVRLSGSCHRVYVTVDDHPNNYTPQVLRILRRYGVTTTFFLTTWSLEAADRYPRHKAVQKLLRYARDILRAKHVIGNHTHNHIYMCNRNASTIYNQLYYGQYWIYRQLGVIPKYWRVPFLANCTKALQAARGMGLKHMTAHLSDIGMSGSKMWRYTRYRARRYKYTIVLFHKFYWHLDAYLKRLLRAQKCKSNAVSTGSTTTVRLP